MCRYKWCLLLPLILLAGPCFAQFGTVSFVPLSGPCSTNTLGFDTTNNVVYSCGSSPNNFWKVVTFETVNKGPLSGTCNPNSLGFDTTNNVVYSCGSAPVNTWTVVGGGGGGGGGAPGFGYIVPTNYPTISAALSAAQAAGSGPVVVLPTSADSTAYSNPTNIRIENYKKTPAGADGMFFRDVSEWGPIDGKVITCNVSSGSSNVSCGGVTFVNLPAPAGDLGKLILIDQTGPPNGQVTGTLSVVSGGTGGTPGLQGVIFNDATDGCNTIDTMPYGYVNVNSSGVPTGNVQWTGNFYGKGCTHPPTSGTVNTVTGTVTFSGGSIVNGDLVSTITAVTGANTITIADTAQVTLSGTGTIYGTDVHDAFQAACNSISKGTLNGGTLTFSGIGLTSHGIDCNSASLKIIGTGYQPLNSTGAGSTLVYAGKTPNATPPANPTAYVLNLAYGWGPVVERIGIRGNSQAMPYGIILSYGSGGGITAPGSGYGTNPMGLIDQTWIGWEWGDTYNPNTPWAPRLQSCIFSVGPGGNNDFWSFDRIYCIGADVGIDYSFDQATNYHFGKLQFQYDNIGFVGINSVVEDYFTSFNRVDITLGSPYWNAATPNSMVRINNYGSESSAMEFEIPLSARGLTGRSAFALDVENGGLGGSPNYNRPDGITSDYAILINGSVKDLSTPRGNILLPYEQCGASGNSAGLNFEFGSLFTTQIQWNTPPSSNATCSGWGGGGHLKIDNQIGYFNTHTDVPYMGTDYFPTGAIPLMLDVNDSQTHIGSLNVQPPNWGTGYGWVVQAVGTTGSKTYNYQMTCTDSLGNETAASPNSNTGGNIFTITNGNATLSTTNYNQIYFINARQGCPKYNLYGDNGVGGAIGYLTTVTLEQMGQYAAVINDQGAWTKTSRVPPTTTNSGSISAGGNLTVAGMATLNNVTINGTCTGTGCGTGGGGGGGGFTVTTVYKSAGSATNYQMLASDFSSSTAQMKTLALDPTSTGQVTFTSPPSTAMPGLGSCVTLKNASTNLLQVANGAGTTGLGTTISSSASFMICEDTATSFVILNRTVINPSLIGPQISCPDTANTDTYTCSTPNTWQFNFGTSSMLSLVATHANTCSTIGGCTLYVANNPGNGTPKSIVKAGPNGAAQALAPGDIVANGASFLIFNGTTQQWFLANPGSALSVPAGFVSGDIPNILNGAINDTGVSSPSSGTISANCYLTGGINCPGTGAFALAQQAANPTAQLGALVCGARTTAPFLVCSQNNGSFLSAEYSFGPTPATAGDIKYFNGTDWTVLAGNNSGTKVLQETSTGVPSWVTGGGGGGLADPGANGIIKRTALNTTAIAVVADYPTLNQNTTGTAAGITSNGTANQVWGMNAGATAQGWQTVTSSGGGTATSYDTSMNGWMATQSISVAGANSTSVAAVHFHYGRSDNASFHNIILFFNTVTSTEVIAYAIWDVTSAAMVCHSVAANPPTATTPGTFPCVETSPQLIAGHDYFFLRADTGSSTTAFGASTGSLMITKYYSTNVTTPGFCTFSSGTVGSGGISCSAGSAPALGSSYTTGNGPHVYLE